MKKHTIHLKNGRFHIGFLSLAGVAVVFLLLAVFGVMAMSQRAHAETADGYCAQYTSNSKINACKSGIRGQSCSDYAVTFDQATADVCTQAARAKANGQVSDQPSFNASTDGSSATDRESYRNVILNACVPYQSNAAAAAACLYGGLGKDGKGSSPQSTTDCLTNPLFSGSTAQQGACITGVTAGQNSLAAKTSSNTSTSNSNPGGNFSSLQDILDQSKNLSGLIDAVHALSPNAGVNTGLQADNNYASYVNGAGKQQPIKVLPGKGCTTNPGAGGGINSGLGGINNGLGGLGGLSNGLGGLGGLGNGLNGVGGSGLNGSQNSGLGGLGGLGGLSSLLGGSSSNNNYGFNNPYTTPGLNGLNSPLGGNTNGAGGNTIIINNGGTINVNNGGGAAGGACPAIIMFNGGGWHSDDGTSDQFAAGNGNKNTNSDQKMDKPVGGGANERGYTVIEVTYRLGSSGVYYMLDDVLRGVQHVRNNSGMYGIDPSKIAIMGDSAGGSLALRAGASGKSGAKVMVGWSAPTNAYTALFKSFKSFMIGMDHSTCIPTDLAGMTNFTDLLNGGSGNVAQYGQGLSSNDFSGLGLSNGAAGPLPTGTTSPGGDPISTITQVLTAGQYAAQTGQNLESISQQMQSGGIQGMSGSLINLSTKKLMECIDNFNTLSPALFASPGSPPGFLAGFDNDDLIDPQQLYDMRDKLQGLGVKAEAVVIPGDPAAAANAPALGASDNHLGYDPRFVCPTLDFIDSIIQPSKPKIDCTKPTPPPANNSSTGGGGGNPTKSSGGNPTPTKSSGGNCPSPGEKGSGLPLSDFCNSLQNGVPQNGGPFVSHDAPQSTCTNLGSLMDVSNPCNNFQPLPQSKQSTATPINPNALCGRVISSC